jgi:pyridinium-3,5-biscarboxylic acid mononucleotide synthase
MTDGLQIDTGREKRQGFPEVVFGRGKTPEQTCAAVNQLLSANGHALATGIDENTAARLVEQHSAAVWNPASHTLSINTLPLSGGKVAIICAGTSDLAVADEAAHTCTFLGHKVLRMSDVGVAGIHRFLDRLSELADAHVIIVIAGMEGALASVVGGLVSQPVIAVPTSVGYGTGLGGIAALMSMLNTCAAGVAVMNIDNGFGAALAAHRILHMKVSTAV